MKKLRKSLLIVFALIMVLATVFVFVGCNKNDNTPTVEAKSIAVTVNGGGDKVVLEESNATVDAIKSAIKVVVTMSDDSKVTVTDYEVSGFNASAEGVQTVTIKHSNLTATVKVEVQKASSDATPVSLELSNSRVELLESNATVDAIKSAITVKVVYSDDSKVTVTDYEVVGFNASAEGEQTVTIKHSGLEATLTVVVSHSQVETPVLETITVNPTTVTMDQDTASVDTLMAMITVSANYTDGTSQVVTVYDVLGLDATIPGAQTVTISYEGKTADITVIINPSVSYGYVVVINGMTTINLQPLGSDDMNVTEQYYATLMLNAGDSIAIYGEDGTEYANYEPECPFKGTATVSGEHTVYFKLYQDGGDSIWVSAPQGGDPIVSGYAVIVNGETYEMTILDSDDVNVVIQYTATLMLNAGDTIVFVDENGTEVEVNYEPECPFKGTATADGEHTVYLKFYQDGGNSVWVAGPVGGNDNPGDYYIYVVINGDTANPVILTATDSAYADLEYTGSFTLAIGDYINVYGSDGYEFTNYENADAFSGTATVDGVYTIYVKCYSDMSNQIWTEVPSGSDTPVDPDPDYYVYVIINGDEDSIVILEANYETPYASVEYFGSFTLEVGDTIKVLATDGYEFTTYENADEFSGTATVAGVYTIYVKCQSDMTNAIWTAVPSGSDTPVDPEAGYTVVVGEEETEMTIEPAADENVTIQYMATVTLVKGDVVKIVDAEGNELKVNYEKECGFTGTASVDGEYVIYLKFYKDGGNSAWVVVPEGGDTPVDPDPEYAIYVIINGDEATKVVMTKNAEQTNWDEYMATFTLEVGDTIKVVATDGYEFKTYENADDFAGIAKVEGEYTIYLKCYSDYSNIIWTAVPSGSDTPVDPEAGYTVVVGEEETEMTIEPAADENVTIQYMATVTLVKGDVVKIVDAEGNELKVNYEKECGFTGTASVDGEYVIYLKFYKDGGNSAWVVVPEGGDTPVDPEYAIYVIINGDEATKVVMTKNAEQTVWHEYMATFELKVGDKIKVVATDGYEFKTYENADDFAGIAKVEGEYTIYLKCYSDMSNAIWTAVPENGDDPVDPEPEDYYIYVVINGDKENAVILTKQDSEYASFEYTGSFELKVGDKIQVFGSDGYEYKVYENADDFAGTAKVDGEYTIYVKCYEDMTNQIYTAVPAGSDTPVDPEPTPSTYAVVVGEEEVKMEVLESDDTNVVLQLTAKLTLKNGDTIKFIEIIDGKSNNVQVNYEQNCPFQGKATADGDYTVYLKFYKDGGNSVWVSVPEGADTPVDPDPEDYYIYVVINGNEKEPIILTKQDSEYASFEYTGSFELKVGDKIQVFGSDGYEYKVYENADAFSGTAKVAGEYTIYVKCYEDMTNQIYTAVPAGTVTPDPDAKDITVYYYNANKWTNVYAHIWGTSDYTKWPGNKMTAVEGHDGWYSITFPSNYSNILFNAGDNNDSHKTKDLKVDGENLYYNGYEWTDGFNLHEGKTTITVYYHAKNASAKITAYAWNGGLNNGSWPGVEMKAVEGHSGWFVLEISMDYVNILFCENGNKVTNNDLDIPTGKDTVYFDGNTSKWVDKM